MANSRKKTDAEIQLEIRKFAATKRLLNYIDGNQGRIKQAGEKLTVVEMIENFPRLALLAGLHSTFIQLPMGCGFNQHDVLFGALEKVKELVDELLALKAKET